MYNQPPPSGPGYQPAYGPPPGYGGQYQGQQRPQGPMPHPHAITARALGVAALLLMPLTGIPAIILGAKAAREIKEQPHRYSGAGIALTGRVLGWVGCGELAWLIASANGSRSTALGIVFAVVGVAGVAAALFGAFREGPLRRVPPLSIFISGALILGGVVGIVRTRNQAAEWAAECANSKAQITTGITKNNFPAARTALVHVRAVCPRSDAEQADAIEKQIASLEAAWNQEQSDRQIAQREAAAKKKEGDAIATWPQASTDIAAAHKRASTDAALGKWSDADADLRPAELALPTFAGTSVAQAKPWSELDAKVRALRQRIDPQLTAIAKSKSDKAAAQALADEDALLRQLLAQYKDNEVRADGLYKGKVTQFSGIVDTVKKDILGSIYVTVGTGEWLQIPQVQCYFDASRANDTARLSKGDHVRMRGRVDGLMMNVLIKECEILH